MAYDRKKIEDSIAYCGLVCSFCIEDGSCSCKSETTNHCGRRLSPEGCRQYTCCQANGYSGCWECSVFPCDDSLFHSVRIRAFVRCIQEDGLVKFAEYLKRNADNGFIYHQPNSIKGDYDAVQTQEQVLSLLRGDT